MMENLENIDNESFSEIVSEQNSKSSSISGKNKSNILNKNNKKTRNIEIIPEITTKADLSFKIILIGDMYSGKSSLVSTIVKNTFEPIYNATIGFDTVPLLVKINDTILKLQIWDTCGQEIYKSLIKNFYRESSLVIMVYSINNKESFENISEWLKEIKTSSNSNAKLFLIGNKNDLEKEREVSYEEARQFAINSEFCKFFETSAKTGTNVQKTFYEAANVLYDEYFNITQSLSNDFSSLSNIKESILINNYNESINAIKGKSKRKRDCC